MLIAYLIALVVGGVLIAVSMFFGDIDADADVDTDTDTDTDTDSDAAGVVDFGSVLPITSLRFWTFFLAFGGFVGGVLTWTESAAPLIVGLVSAAAGYLSALLVSTVTSRLRHGSASSEVSANDCLGEVATVVLPVSRERPGQVRMRIKGRDLHLMARTDDDAELDALDEALVYEVRDDGVLLVTRHGNPNRPS
jgi:membrane protein implicated in regulation of membrane protease activity